MKSLKRFCININDVLYSYLPVLHMTYQFSFNVLLLRLLLLLCIHIWEPNSMFKSLYKSNKNIIFSYIKVIKNMLCCDLNIIYYWMLWIVCIWNIFKHFNQKRLLSYEYFSQTSNQSFDDRFQLQTLAMPFECLSSARLWCLMDAIPDH